MPLAREEILSPTWADGLRVSRGRQAGRQAGRQTGSRAAGTAVLQPSGVWQGSSRASNAFCSPLPRECHGFLQARVNRNGKVGFLPGMEEHKWQGMAAGLPLSTISAVKAVPVMVSQLSAAGSADPMTAFHQQSSCRFCLFLPLCLPRNACGSFYPKKPACPTEGKGFKAFCGLVEGKSLALVFFHIAFNLSILFSMGVVKAKAAFYKMLGFSFA